MSKDCGFAGVYLGGLSGQDKLMRKNVSSFVRVGVKRLYIAGEIPRRRYYSGGAYGESNDLGRGRRSSPDLTRRETSSWINPPGQLLQPSSKSPSWSLARGRNPNDLPAEGVEYIP